jgi:hypothetical protein
MKKNLSPTHRLPLAIPALVVTSLTLVTLSATPTEAQSDRPLLKVPFSCNQEWKGATYNGHDPDRALDLNLRSGGDSDLGQPVKASANGRVIRAENVGTGYGNLVVIEHNGTWSTAYAHLNQINVQRGQTVTDATTIGTVGKSGGQTYTHLHYEQRKSGTPVSIMFGTSTDVKYYNNDQSFTRTRC